MQSEFDRENEAAWIVATELSGIPNRLDDRSKRVRSKECDFEILLPDGSRVSLEVTSSTVKERAEQVRAIGSGAWACPGIERSWSIQLDGAGRRKTGARVKKFKSNSPSHLVQLEKECPLGGGDLLNFDFSLEFSEAAREAIAALRELGVRHGSLLDKPPYGPAYAAIGWVYDSVPNDPSLKQVVEEAALANQGKLNMHSDCERHLFVWIDQTDYRNWADLCTFQVPSEPLDVSSSVDQVWTGPWSPGINFDGSLHSLISSRGNEPWIRHMRPSVADYYQRNTGKSAVTLKHLTEGRFPFGNAQPWKTLS